MSPANVVDLTVDGVSTVALIDTGAAVSVLNERLSRALRKVTTPLSGFSLRTASAQPVRPSAACTARVIIQGVLYIVEFVVLQSCSHDVILGWDFLSRNNAVINCARAEVELSPLCDVPLVDATSLPAKLVLREDIAIPPYSSAVVPVFCGAVSEGAVLFTPSELFITRKDVPLPFATLHISAPSLSAIRFLQP